MVKVIVNVNVQGSDLRASIAFVTEPCNFAPRILRLREPNVPLRWCLGLGCSRCMPLARTTARKAGEWRPRGSQVPLQFLFGAADIAHVPRPRRSHQIRIEENQRIGLVWKEDGLVAGRCTQSSIILLPARCVF